MSRYSAVKRTRPLAMLATLSNRSTSPDQLSTASSAAPCDAATSTAVVSATTHLELALAPTTAWANGSTFSAAAAEEKLTAKKKTVPSAACKVVTVCDTRAQFSVVGRRCRWHMSQWRARAHRHHQTAPVWVPRQACEVGRSVGSLRCTAARYQSMLNTKDPHVHVIGGQACHLTSVDAQCYGRRTLREVFRGAAPAPDHFSKKSMKKSSSYLCERERDLSARRLTIHSYPDPTAFFENGMQRAGSDAGDGS